MEQEIEFCEGDASGTIDNLINFLNKAKAKGATHYKMEWSNDPMWSFKWFRAYRRKTKEEQQAEEIEKLQFEIDRLKKQNLN
jgi:hypothetical protein